MEARTPQLLYEAVAEDMPELDLGTFRLVTFGQSFQWTDRERVAEAVYDILEPGGALALIDALWLSPRGATAVVLCILAAALLGGAGGLVCGLLGRAFYPLPPVLSLQSLVLVQVLAQESESMPV